MAQNPMQVKVRNARLIGIVIGLLIGAVVCIFPFMQLSKIKKERDAEKATYTSVNVLAKDIKSGTEITSADFTQVSLPRTLVPNNFITAVGEGRVAKIDLKANTVITEEMVSLADEKTEVDTRLQEYTMIVLPTYLAVDDYIDIRLALPNGQDLLVIPKKRVHDVNADTVWLQMNEDETVSLNSAIIESYVISGSKLYAAPYVDPGLQTKATSTYVPASEVVKLINSNPNITEDTRNKLTSAFNQSARIRTEDLAKLLELYRDNAVANVQTAVEQDKKTMKDARTEYFDTLNAVEEPVE